VCVSPINVAGMAGPKLASGARVAGQLIAPSEEHNTETIQLRTLLVDLEQLLRDERSLLLPKMLS